MQMGVDDDNKVPALARLVEAVHAHGVKIFAQLSHSGREVVPAFAGLPEAVSASDVTDLSTGTYTGVAALNFVTPDTATTGAKNGNAAADRTAISTTIASLSIPSRDEQRALADVSEGIARGIRTVLKREEREHAVAKLIAANSRRIEELEAMLGSTRPRPRPA